MIFSRIFALTDIVLRAHILNPFWWTRNRRRARRVAVASVAIPRYLARYVDVGRVPAKKVTADKNEKVFSIWQQGENAAPKLIRACWRAQRANLRQELIVLDDKTLPNYIDLPGVIMDKRASGQIKNAHFADICRVELLYNHGGIWMDATNFATRPIDDFITEQDFFVFMAGRVGSPYSFIQNCFIRARKNSYLLAAWRNTILNFWKSEPREFDYFMHQLMFKATVQHDSVARELFEKMPHVDQDPTHALWWDVAGKPFDKKLFDKITSGAFFQKLTYRGENANNPKPGSFADEMINKMYK